MKLESVLLVDDDRPTNFLHTRLLRKIGCEAHIHQVYSVGDALNYLLAKDVYSGRSRDLDPQLILLDLNMPKVGGWAFLDDYARHFSQDEHILIVLTTSLNPDDEHMARASEFVTEFRRKPMTTEVMAEILETYFNPGAEFKV